MSYIELCFELLATTSLSFVKIFESFDFLVSWFSSSIDFMYLIEFGLSFESIVVFQEFIIFEAVAGVVR